MHYNHTNCDIYLTTFYAKCTATEMRDLWSNLENIHTQIKGPWYIGGDFKIILDPDEKKGGNPHRMHRSFEFSSCMDNCEVADLGFVSPKFTWYNNWKARKRIWKRLDRVFVNDLWSQIFQSNMVRHLARTGSDHRPLLIKCQKYLQACIKYFKFLDFWVEQPSFMKLVEEVWSIHIPGNSMWRLQQKLKLLGNELTQWSKEDVGNVFDQVNTREDKMLNLEELDTLNNTDQFREEINKGQAEYIKWLDNDLLNAIPDDEEIRNVIFSINASSAAGPDGFNGTFYQKCWNIIKYDIIDFVQDFFNGKGMTKFYTHTCLIPIPKVDSPTSFSEFRPISLSNFTNKIISKILSRRLNPMLEKLISDNHGGFVKGGMITTRNCSQYKAEQKWG
ncbi:uncharacterized protein LOC142171470 [Nicotiana tabacum]|uniref:Uncharacterized protein LOC142171470 n=1 Tax=Nicotiana tabacum TaxID=4097 RepID=A0AC58SY78_TOBAC